MIKIQMAVLTERCQWSRSCMSVFPAVLILFELEELLNTGVQQPLPPCWHSLSDIQLQTERGCSLCGGFCQLSAAPHHDCRRASLHAFSVTTFPSTRLFLPCSESATVLRIVCFVYSPAHVTLRSVSASRLQPSPQHVSFSNLWVHSASM